MVTNTQSFAELLAPGLLAIYGDEYKQHPEEYSAYLQVENAPKRAYVDTLSMTGLGLASVKAEGKGIDYDEALQGYTHRITYVTYALGFIVTREMYEDDLYGKIRAFPKFQARSLRHTVEIIGANNLNRATTSGYTGADGQVLASLTHPLIGGGNFQNRPTNYADLSMTSYQQALMDIAVWVDDKGLYIAAKPKLLVYSAAGMNDWTAKQLLGSEKDPENSTNAINPAKNDVKAKKLHWMTDPDAWDIITDVPEGLKFHWRRRPEFDKDNDPDSENAKFKSTMRCAAFWDDPRGIYHNSGS